MTDNTVARTILAQLGGNRFLAMTGAKALVYGERSITFSLPVTMTKGKANRLTIALAPTDVYVVETLKSTVANPRKVLERENGIYCDGLRDSVERLTGLATSL